MASGLSHRRESGVQAFADCGRGPLEGPIVAASVTGSALGLAVMQPGNMLSLTGRGHYPGKPPARNRPRSIFAGALLGCSEITMFIKLTIVFVWWLYVCTL